jgi:hypothetical protein
MNDLITSFLIDEELDDKRTEERSNELLIAIQVYSNLLRR